MSSLTPQAKSARAMPARGRSKGPDYVDILVFLIPCLQLIRIRIVGVLNGSDLMMLAVFLYLAFRGRLRIATPGGKWTIFLCSLWLASQCVTDIVRHTALADYARGWSNIGLTLVNLAVVWTLLYGRPRRLLLYGWGLVVGDLLYFFINPNESMAAGAPGDAWKFGFAFPISLGVFLIASRKECRGLWAITLAVLAGVASMVEGGRNIGGECLAAAVYLVVTGSLRRKSGGSSKLKAATVLALAASIILGIAGVLWAYQYAATAGILGQTAQDTYEEESSGKYGLLLGGRTEILATLPAIYDSPILGHGSWAKEPLYIILQNQALARLGYTMAWDISNEDLQEGLIPTHSYFFGAWVDGGILGAVFWGWIYVLTARAFLRVYPDTAVLLPVASFLGFLMLWEILFSPYGTPGRVTFPYSFVMMMTFASMAPQKAVQVATVTSKKRTSTAKRRVHAGLAPRPQQ